MPIVSTSESLSRRPGGGAPRILAALGALFAPLINIAGRMIRQRRIRQAHDHLMELDDRTLRDLGIDRSEIGRVVRFGRDGFGMELAARDAHPVLRRSH